MLRLLRLRSPPDLPASAALRARGGRAGDRVSVGTLPRRPEAGAGRAVEIQKRAGADVPLMRVRGVEAQRRGRARAGQRGEVRASRVTHALTSKRARRRNGRQGAGEVEEGRQRGHLRFGRGRTVSGREGRLRNVPERIIGRGARGSRRRSRRARGARAACGIKTSGGKAMPARGTRGVPGRWCCRRWRSAAFRG